MKKTITKVLLLSTLALIGLSVNAQWKQTYDGIVNSGPINCIAVSGTNTFAGTYFGGVFFSTNGISWTAVNNGLTSTRILSLAISGTNIFAGTYDGGVFLSTNNGSSWTAVNNGLIGTRILSLAISGTNIFAGTYDAVTYRGGMFLSTNNGSSWTAISSMKDKMILSLAINGTNIFAGTNSAVYLSTDNGSSWTALINKGLPPGAMPPSLAASGTNIFAACDGYGMYFSTNNGSLWTKAIGLPSTNVLSVATSGTNIFVGNANGRVFLSTDTCKSWTDVSYGLSSAGIAQFAISETNIFVATTTGVFKRPLSDLMGIEENSDNASFMLYPNPSNGTFTIEANRLSNNTALNIYSIDGRLVYTEKINSTQSKQKHTISLKDQDCGVYFIKMINNENVVVKKLVIQK